MEGISEKVTHLSGVDGRGDIAQHVLKNIFCIWPMNPLALANYREHIICI